MRNFQTAYELTDDEMGTGEIFTVCRRGYVDPSGMIQTTGQPVTTTVPPFSLPKDAASAHQEASSTASKSTHPLLLQTTLALSLLSVLLIAK